jgi:hypothetical protein
LGSDSINSNDTGPDNQNNNEFGNQKLKEIDHFDSHSKLPIVKNEIDEEMSGDEAGSTYGDKRAK